MRPRLCKLAHVRKRFIREHVDRVGLQSVTVLLISGFNVSAYLRRYIALISHLQLPEPVPHTVKC